MSLRVMAEQAEALLFWAYNNTEGVEALEELSLLAALGEGSTIPDRLDSLDGPQREQAIELLRKLPHFSGVSS